MKDHSTQNLIDIASELGVSRERILNVIKFDGFLSFQVGSRDYTNKLTPTGRHKKNSVRLG
jgi:hypothetical protein